MNKRITEEQRQKAIKLYNTKQHTNVEISNLTGISVPKLTQIFRECFKNGILTPKSKAALKPRTPNGQGRGPYVKKGYNYWNRKFTPEDLEKIAEEYYVGGLTNPELHEKYGLFPPQIQRMRNLYGWKYKGMKKRGRKKLLND